MAIQPWVKAETSIKFTPEVLVVLAQPRVQRFPNCDAPSEGQVQYDIYTHYATTL